MRRDLGTLIAGILMACTQLLLGANAGRCQLRKGLYEERLALAQKHGSAESGSSGALLSGDIMSAPGGKSALIDQEYARFLEDLSAAVEQNDTAALTACCQ